MACQSPVNDSHPPTAPVMNPKPRSGCSQIGSDSDKQRAWLHGLALPVRARPRERLAEQKAEVRMMQVRRRTSYGTAPAAAERMCSRCLVAPGKLQESFRSAIPAEGWVGWGGLRSQRLLKGVRVNLERYERGGCIILYCTSYFSRRRSPTCAWMFGRVARVTSRPNSWMRFVLVSDHGGCLA